MTRMIARYLAGWLYDLSRTEEDDTTEALAAIDFCLGEVNLCLRSQHRPAWADQIDLLATKATLQRLRERYESDR